MLKLKLDGSTVPAHTHPPAYNKRIVTPKRLTSPTCFINQLNAVNCWLTSTSSLCLICETAHRHTHTETHTLTNTDTWNTPHKYQLNESFDSFQYVFIHFYQIFYKFIIVWEHFINLYGNELTTLYSGFNFGTKYFIQFDYFIFTFTGKIRLRLCLVCRFIYCGDGE